MTAMRSAATLRRERWAPVIAAAVTVSGCTPAVLSPAGPVALAERTILIDSMVIMLAIVVPTLAISWAFAWWFRSSNRRAPYLPTWAYSGRIELVVWSIPLLTVILLGGVSWIGSHQLDPARPLSSRVKPLEIQVISLDWKWLFIYPDQSVASVNELDLPVGVPVHLTLTSSSVMNAFFVPRLGSMIYTMNGMASQLYLQADAEGAFDGLSAHFSGDGFPGMHFTVHAVSAPAFAAWIEQARLAGPTLTRASYQFLARQSSNTPAFHYRGVEPGLFDAVVRQVVPPADGPPATAWLRDVSPHQDR